jgi:pSer/pThr/pTyr-binding forkhead associated (FHA) protein
MNEDNRIDRASSIGLLKIVTGINRGKSFPLYASKEYIIGRAQDCEIIIDGEDKKASRRHALLRVEKDRFVLENLSKTNR